MIKYAVITDEISQDIGVAAELASEFGLDGIEIRSVNDRPPQLLTDDDIAEIKGAMEKYNLRCAAISSPVFKCDLTEENIEENIKILKKCISLAHTLGTKFIRAFTFFKGGSFEAALPEIVDAYQKIYPILCDEDIYLLLESDPSLNASCGKTLSEVIRAINLDRVKGLWDPGNDIYSPEQEIPYPDGYSYMKNTVSHVHIKDAVKNPDGTISGAPFGKGDVDFVGQLTALRDDGYEGWMVMETHYRVKCEIPEELLTRPQGSAFSLGGYEATKECLTNFFEMIDKLEMR